MKNPTKTIKFAKGIHENCFNVSVCLKKQKTPKAKRQTETPTLDTMSMTFGLNLFDVKIDVTAKRTMTTPITMLATSELMFLSAKRKKSTVVPIRIG
jgi:hypothetical protein